MRELIESLELDEVFDKAASALKSTEEIRNLPTNHNARRQEYIWGSDWSKLRVYMRRHGKRVRVRLVTHFGEQGADNESRRNMPRVARKLDAALRKAGLETKMVIKPLDANIYVTG